MLINCNGQLVPNNKNNNSTSKLFKLPQKKLNIQSRNITNYNNYHQQKRNSLYSTKETTPGKEQTNLDDSMSNFSDILLKNKKHLNFKDLIGKIPGISGEPNFAYDLILYNKRKNNKAKKLSKKIGVLKLPIYNGNFIQNKYKETLNNCDRNKSQNYFEKKNKNDETEVTCCFFMK